MTHAAGQHAPDAGRPDGGGASDGPRPASARAAAEPDPADAVFFDLPRWEGSKQRLAAAFGAMPGAFRDRATSDEFFSYMVTPRSGRWAFRPNGKAATTTALEALFFLEFGHPNTARIADPTDMNPDAAVHRMAGSGVFRHLHLRHDAEDLPGFLRATDYVATVRHPGARALSAFRYLCRSHRAAHPQFAAERFRMTALTGFDWDRHDGTEEGFRRFLDYVRLCNERQVGRPVNNHFRPQADTIRPDLFPPAVLGRVEDMPAFFRDLADRLRPGAAMPQGWADRRANRGAPAQAGDIALLRAPGVRRRIEACYAADFEAFGYDP